MPRAYKKYEELNFSDDFMFTKILTTRKDLCIQLLEVILGKKIRDITYLSSHESIDILYDQKGIALDVYLEDDANTVYNLEMQTTNSGNLPRRSRYYQTMIDANALESGALYDTLKDSYVIFICLSDPFKDNLPVYTFSHVCMENMKTLLDDGETRIFLNAKGKSETMQEPLRDFLNYLQGSVNSDNMFIRDLDDAVLSAREHKEWRLDYMSLTLKLQDEKMEGRREGIEIGREEGRQEGRQEGREEGREEGLLAERKKVIMTLFSKKSMSVEDISELLDIPADEVQEIINNSDLLKL